MSTFNCVVFTLGHHRFALPLDCVERVVRAVEVTPLPDTPDTVAGVINVQGRLVPVVDLRRRSEANGASEPIELELNDQLVIARNGDDLVAVVANTVEGVAAYDSAEIVASEATSGKGSEAGHLHGLIATGDDIIMVRHPSHFLQSHEQAALAGVLESTKAT